MSKPKAQRRVAENEAMAKSTSIRTSPTKINLVAQLIRGKSAEQALADLTFSKRRVAKEVKKVLQAAIANAENNHNLDVDRLYVSSATVGKALVMKRFMARGRGRSTRIEKFFSNITVVVREREQKVAEKKTDKTAAKTEAKATKKASKKEAA
jgi:large subunit ribosomal protein L22